MTEHAALFEFEQFYAAYPRKVARRHAEKIWLQLKVDAELYRKIMDGLAQQCAVWEDDGTAKQFIPHPGTWLNGHRWEDEIEALAQRSEKPPERIEYEGNVLVWDGGWRREKGA
jgi:hypothetical protein